MANWDFCQDCNGGKHCCRHDNCDCSSERSIGSYSISELREEIKKRKKGKERLKQQQEIERQKTIKNLEKELRRLKRTK